MLQTEPSTESAIELCLAHCSECLITCEELARRLYAGPASFTTGACILSLLDCAQACEVAMGFIGRNSALQEEFSAICGEVCEACAARLELTGGHEHCAEICRRCADACFEAWNAASGPASVKTQSARAGHDEAGAEASQLRFAGALTS